MGFRLFLFFWRSLFIGSLENLNFQMQKIVSLILLSAPFMLVFTLVFIGATYSNVCISLILGEEVKNESILLRIIKKKIGFYSRLLLIVNP
ncbi:Protein traS [Salmonella enterica subsp. arizonae]|nr:Protein traS [Salmonella enterica subsp. arizonae]